MQGLPHLLDPPKTAVNEHQAETLTARTPTLTTMPGKSTDYLPTKPNKPKNQIGALLPPSKTCQALPVVQVAPPALQQLHRLFRCHGRINGRPDLPFHLLGLGAQRHGNTAGHNLSDVVIEPCQKLRCMLRCQAFSLHQPDPEVHTLKHNDEGFGDARIFSQMLKRRFRKASDSSGAVLGLGLLRAIHQKKVMSAANIHTCPFFSGCGL